MNIKQWLEEKGFGQYAELFEGNEITLEELPEIATHDDLKEIGIKSFIHRKQILTEIAALSALTPGEAEQQKVSAKDGHKAPSSSRKEPGEKIQKDDASSHLKLDEQEQQIIKSYPYLIAYPFQEMLDEKNAFIKINLLKDVFLNVLKYLGLVIATEYFRSSSQSREINDLFRDKIYRPQFGHWNHFLRVTIKYLQSENHSFFMPGLVDFYQRVETGGGKRKVKRFKTKVLYTDEFGNLNYRKSEETLIGNLINFRNTHLGHGNVPREEEAKKIFDEYYPFLKILLSEMDFCKDYQMIKYEDGHLYSLMGTILKEIEKNTKTINEDERVWLQNSEGDKMPLVPFFIVPKEYIAGISENTELFVYEQFTGKRILFFSPERGRGESTGKILNKLKLLIDNKSKETPLTLQTLTEEILKEQINYVNKNITESLINERKVIKGIYQQRDDAEISLKSWVKGRASIYFLTAEAGGGKTNLLNEMARQYLESGFDTLLLRANRFSFNNFEEQLKHELNLEDDFAFEQFEFFQREGDNPFLILIDGLNECKNPPDLLSSIKEFQSKLKTGGVKIVISWRANTIKALPELDESWESFLYNAGDDNQEIENILAKNTYWLKRMSKIELEGAWNHYTSQKEFKTNFTLKELTYKDRLLVDKLSNPLLLRMFLELFHGKALKDLTDGAINLWKLWYKDISKTEGADKILLSLTSLMLEKEKSILFLDTLYDHPVLSSYVRDIQINNPYQRLVEKGILSQYFIDNEIVVSFTMEALFYYYLSISIENNEKYNAVEKLLELTNTNKLTGIKEAVKYILWNDIQNSDYSRLNYFIGKGNDYLEITYFPLAQAFILHDIDEVLKNVLPEESSKNEWYAVEGAITELKSVQEELVKKDLLVKIQPYINVDSFVECKILLDSLEFISVEDQTELLDQIIGYISTSDNLAETDKIILFNKIGEGYLLGGENYELADNEKALEYFFKSLAIIEKIQGKEHIDIATLYDKIEHVYLKELALGGYDNAIKYLKKSLAIKEKVLGKEHLDTAKSYNDIGHLYSEMGWYKDAAGYLEKSLKIREKILGKEHPDTATSYNNIGLLFFNYGTYEKALEYYFKSLTIREKIYGIENLSTAELYNNISLAYNKMGDHRKSLDFLIKVLKINEKVLGEKHSDVATTLHRIGIVYNNLEEYKNALKYFVKSLALKEKTYKKESPAPFTSSYNAIGLIYKRFGEYDKAIQMFENSLKYYEDSEFYEDDCNDIRKTKKIIDEIKSLKKSK